MSGFEQEIALLLQVAKDLQTARVSLISPNICCVFSNTARSSSTLLVTDVLIIPR